MWLLMWLNRSIVIINATFQLLDIDIYIYIYIYILDGLIFRKNVFF